MTQQLPHNTWTTPLRGRITVSGCCPCYYRRYYYRRYYYRRYYYLQPTGGGMR